MSFYTYLKQLPPIPSHEELKDLSRRIKDGDESARVELYHSTLRLAVRGARKHSYSGNFQDFVQEGNIGLLKAVRKYKPDIHDFIPYASSYIKWHIKKSIYNDRMIRIPPYLRVLLGQVQRVKIRYYQEKGHDPSPQKITEILNNGSARYNVSQIQRVSEYFANTKTFSFDEPVNPRTSTLLGSFIPDRKAQSPLEVLANSLIRSQVNSLIAARLERLPIKQEAILRLRYGIGYEDPKTLAKLSSYLRVPVEYVEKFLATSTEKEATLEEIGSLLGITRQRVEQIEKKAIEKLRKGSKIKKYASILNQLLD